MFKVNTNYYLLSSGYFLITTQARDQRDQRGQSTLIQQHLLAEVWVGAVGEISALQRCIGLLRNRLGDDGRKQKVIAHMASLIAILEVKKRAFR